MYHFMLKPMLHLFGQLLGYIFTSISGHTDPHPTYWMIFLYTCPVCATDDCYNQFKVVLKVFEGSSFSPYLPADLPTYLPTYLPADLIIITKDCSRP